MWESEIISFLMEVIYLTEKKYLKGIFLGSLIGTTFLLLDRNSRKFLTMKLNKTPSKIKQYVQTPSYLVHDIRIALDSSVNYFENVSNQMIHEMSKVEQMMDKLEKK